MFGFYLIERKERPDFIDFSEWDITSGVSDIYQKEKLWQLNERTESGVALNLKDCEKEITWDFFTNMTMKFVSFDVLD